MSAVETPNRRNSLEALGNKICRPFSLGMKNGRDASRETPLGFKELGGTPELVQEEGAMGGENLTCSSLRKDQVAVRRRRSSLKKGRNQGPKTVEEKYCRAW